MLDVAPSCLNYIIHYRILKLVVLEEHSVMVNDGRKIDTVIQTQ